MRAFKTSKPIISLLIAFISIGITANAWSSINEGKTLAKERWFTVGIEATVESINKERRELTLKEPNGTLETVFVTDAVKRFNEIKIGDTIKAEYITFLKAEFREPSAKESAAPLVIAAETVRVPKKLTPAVQLEQRLKRLYK